MKGQRVFKNAVALLIGQPITWMLTLVFTVMVPRNVGPIEWGEWTIAQSLGQLSSVLFDLGMNTVLVKAISRRPEQAQSQIGAVMTARLILAPLMMLTMLGFSLAVGYSQHTQILIALAALSFGFASITATAASALQGFERMHLSAFASVLTGMILTTGAVVMVKILALGVISICALAVCSQIIGGVPILVWLNRQVQVRPTLDWRLVHKLVREGMPYWASRGTFTAYAWLAAVMISLLGATQENGWYSVAFQMMSLPGFLIYAVTTAVLPALSRGFVDGGEQTVDLMARSFRLLVSLSLPMAAGLALVSGNLVALLYGAWFAPAGHVLALVALVIPSVFVATLIGTFLIAIDRQTQWTCAMAGLCVVNLLLNMISIPYFHAHHGNGALGAAVTLLVTDTASGILALVLLPTNVRAAIRKTARSILGAALATVVMAAIVWPLRRLFIPIPVITGALVFAGSALALRVFPRNEIEILSGPVWRLAGRLHPAFAPAALPVLDTESEVG